MKDSQRYYWRRFPRRSGQIPLLRQRYDHRRRSSHSRSPLRNGRYDSLYETHRRNIGMVSTLRCWGCCSKDHILSERNCTPTAADIQTNILNSTSCTQHDVRAIYVQYFTLHSSQSKNSSSVPNAHASDTNMLVWAGEENIARQNHFENDAYQLEEV